MDEYTKKQLENQGYISGVRVGKIVMTFLMEKVSYEEFGHPTLSATYEAFMREIRLNAPKITINGNRHYYPISWVNNFFNRFRKV